MVILFLKQMWFVLALNRHAQMVVSGQEPAQEMGTGLLSLPVPAAKCETAFGLPVGLKIKMFWGFLMPPRLETNTMPL